MFESFPCTRLKLPLSRSVKISAIRRVAVALSGGVDSAVSAWLLKQRGFDVVGVYMVNWDHVEEGEFDCPRTKDQADAERLCEQLKIDFHVVNYVKEYWNRVFVDMLENCKRGRTVVSDVWCNKYIKFDLLHKTCFDDLKVDAVATGHFARTSFGDFLEKFDENQDQTYFLSSLTQDQLRRVMFPIGSLYKPRIREIAKEAELHVYDKAESMGICFVGKRTNFEDFLAKYLDPVPGVIINNRTGKIVGEHTGVHNFTIGKRLSIDSKNRSNEGYYVLSIDWKTQTCENSHHPCLFIKKLSVANLHWIRRPPKFHPDTNIAEIQFRHQRTHQPMKCQLKFEPETKRYLFMLRNPIRATAPGQNLVFYDDEECLGCGEIETVLETL